VKENAGCGVDDAPWVDIAASAAGASTVETTSSSVGTESSSASISTEPKEETVCLATNFVEAPPAPQASPVLSPAEVVAKVTQLRDMGFCGEDDAAFELRAISLLQQYGGNMEQVLQVLLE